MMPDLVAYLLTVSALTSLVGNRIYRQQVPAGAAFPFVRLERSGGPTHHLSGTSPVRIDRLSVTAYASPEAGQGMAAADAVALQLRNALDNYRGNLGTTGYVSILLTEDPEGWEQPADGSSRAACLILQTYQIEYPTTSPNPTEA